MSAGKGKRGAVGAVREWAGNPCGVRVAFICIYVLCQLISSFCRRQQNKISVSDKPLLDKTCCYLSVCLPATLPRCMSWQEASKCILQQQQQEQSAQTLPLFSLCSAQSHTCIQYAYSLVWSGSVNRRHPRTVSQSVRGAFPSSSLPNLPPCRTCLHFLLVNMSVSLHHHRRHQRFCAASICQLVSLSVRPSIWLSVYTSIRFAKPSSPAFPFSTHNTAPLLSCSQLLLQHLCCPARVLCKLCSLFSSS